MTPIEITRKLAEQYAQAKDKAIQDALDAWRGVTGDETPPEELAKSGRAVLISSIARPHIETLHIDGKAMLTITTGDAMGNLLYQQPPTPDGQPVTVGMIWRMKKHY